MAPDASAVELDQAVALLREAGERAGGDWARAFPALAAYPYPLFDYEAEDGVLATL